MRQHGLVAVPALAQIRHADSIMGASAIAATFAQFSFW